MQKRNALLFTFLSLFVPFVTYYWLYIVGKDIQRSYNIKPPSVWLLLVPFLIWPAMFISLITLALPGSDVATTIGATVFILMGLLIIPLSILPLIYMYKFSGNVEKIAGKDLEQLLVFILLWFFAPAAVFVVQDKLNKIIDSPPQQPLTPPSGVF